jgi:pilus assembly protein Flp/PilA
MRVIPARDVTPAGSKLCCTTMIDLLKRLLKDEDGPTAVEYAVMLAMIVVACIGAVHSMANATATSFDTSATELEGVLG